MEPSNQVCSLELARKLKELGVKQDSLCVWVRNAHRKRFLIENRLLSDFYERYVDKGGECYCAFTVAELGELMKNYDEDMFVSYNFDNDESFEWIAQINRWSDITFVGHTEHADTEANARAKMLVYLLENQLIQKA